MALFDRIFKKKSTSTADMSDNKLEETSKTASSLYSELNEIKHSFGKYRQSEKIDQACVITLLDGEKMTVGGADIINEIEVHVRNILTCLENDESEVFKADLKESIDKKLLYFVWRLRESLDTANLYSAQASVFALNYAVIFLTNSVSSTNGTKMADSDFSTIERKIEGCKTIVDAGVETDRYESRKNSLKLQYHFEILPRYDEAHAELLADRAERPQIYEEIDGREPNDLDEEHLTAWKLLARNNNLSRVIKSITETITGIEDDLAKYEVMLNNLKNTVSLYGMMPDSLLMGNMDMIVEMAIAASEEIIAKRDKIYNQI